MNVLIDDAIVIAVGGLIAKEATSLIIKLRAKRNGNGKDSQIKSLLADIKGQGALTLQKVGGIEKEQGEIKTNLAVVTSEMANFKEKCVMLDSEVKQVDERLFDHIRAGG